MLRPPVSILPSRQLKVISAASINETNTSENELTATSTAHFQAQWHQQMHQKTFGLLLGRKFSAAAAKVFQRERFNGADHLQCDQSHNGRTEKGRRILRHQRCTSTRNAFGRRAWLVHNQILNGAYQPFYVRPMQHVRMSHNSFMDSLQ